MTASKRIVNAKSGKYNNNIFKRGQVTDPTKAVKSSMPVGPMLLGFFLFVVVGSALLQIVQTATSARLPPA